MAFKKTFVLSDETVNTYGFRIITNGIRLDNAKKNLPCFYDHRTWEVPLGHWENLRVENNRLLAELIINGDNDREKNYINKIENNDIKGASIGADPITWTEEQFYLVHGQTRPTLIDCDLFEASITPLPGNTSALALKHNGSMISLNNNNLNILPSLNEKNMKKIALKLGLAENATENEIVDAIEKLQLAKTNAEGVTLQLIKDAETGLEGDDKEMFITLSKSNINQALKFAEKVKATAQSNETAEQQQPVVVKDVKLSTLINRQNNKVEEGKDCFDYLQKHNKVELARIRKEEPEKYVQLAKDYEAGVRYKAK